MGASVAGARRQRPDHQRRSRRGRPRSALKRLASLASVLALLGAPPVLAQSETAPAPVQSSPLAPPEGTALRDATHADDLALGRHYVWDAARNSWVDPQGQTASASLQDSALAEKTAKAKAEIEAALNDCDEARFDAAVKALSDLLAQTAVEEQTLRNQL